MEVKNRRVRGKGGFGGERGKGGITKMCKFSLSVFRRTAAEWSAVLSFYLRR